MFDVIAAILELVGKWLVISKKRSGFFVSIGGNVFWTYVAIQSELPGLLMLVIVASLLNIRGIIKWRK